LVVQWIIKQSTTVVVTQRFRQHGPPGDSGACACSVAVTFTRPARVWRLVRTGHRMPEPASVVARAQAFAAAARDLRPVVLLCAALLGVPHWLRDRHPAADFDQVLLRRAGITTPPRIRFVDPATKRRTFDQPLGSRPPGRPRKVPEG
jgi:hypothetical protein